MNATKNGGSAFPVTPFSGDGQKVKPQDGMTLRDYFAAKAISHIPILIKHLEKNTSLENIAMHAYQVADAMLAERSK